MSPPESPSRLSPYRLQFGAGYGHLDFGDGIPSLGGPTVETRIGHDFFIGENHALYVGGLFRYANLTGRRTLHSPPSSVSHGHLGLEGRYEYEIAPRVFSFFLNLGLGVSHFHSDFLELGDGTSGRIDNASAFGLSLGGGFSLGRGIVNLFGGWQPNFGVPVEGESGPGRGYNPNFYYFGVGIDVARLVEFAGGRFESPPSLGDFWNGMNSPRALVFGQYNFAAGNPRDIGNIRGMEARLSLYRPSDRSSPLGFGLNLAVGLGDGIEPGAPRADAHRGPYFEFEEAYLNLRLPIGRSTVIQGGKWYIGGQPLGSNDATSFLPIILEDHEYPNNNQMSHSYQFHYAFPLSFGGARLQTLLHDRVMLSFGSLHNWGSLFGNESGTGGFASLAWHPSNFYTGSFTGIFGSDAGRAFTMLSFSSVFCLPSTNQGCMTNNRDTRFNIGSNYTWGQSQGNHWHSFVTYLRLNIFPEFGISERLEYFSDPTGMRTGVAQDLAGFSTTLHVQPLNWLQFRAEYRYDLTTSELRTARPYPSGGQHTFGLGAALTF